MLAQTFFHVLVCQNRPAKSPHIFTRQSVSARPGMMTATFNVISPALPSVASHRGNWDGRGVVLRS